MAGMRRRLRPVARALVALVAVLFGYGAYVYLTLPDVRPLRTEAPATTAFMELRAREANGRRCGLTVGCKRGRDGRACDELLEIALALGDLGNPGGQAPGGAVAFDRRVGAQTMRSQGTLNHGANLLGQPRQPRGGHLFRSDF